MAKQRQQDSRRPKKGGGNQKGGNQKKVEAPKLRRMSSWTLDHKAANVKRHLAQDAKRARRASEAATPRGTARLERRRLARLAAVEQAALAEAIHLDALVESEELAGPAAEATPEEASL